MSNVKKIKHWNMDKLVSVNADINLIYGERSNGKSYQVKHKRAVEKFLNTGKRFILMRRWKEEITTEKIEAYFADVDVAKLTNNEYNCIVMYLKKLYLANYNVETGKTTKGHHIGYVVALSTEQNYAGASYLDVEDIIYEEFMSRTTYLSHESDKLMNFYCTVDRKRGTTKLWLVGNTITRVCPYIADWDLHSIVVSQKQGTIITKEINSTDDDIVKIAIEYCEDTGVSSHTIGKNKKMLNSGSWQTDPQPHLPKSKKDYNIAYRIMFQYKQFSYLADFLIDKENSKNYCWFIYPYNKEPNKKTLVITDKVNISKQYQRDIYNITIKSKRIQEILNTFREGNIFYSTDLCGTEFKQSIDFVIKR